jgi:hypothetical protein
LLRRFLIAIVENLSFLTTTLTLKIIFCTKFLKIALALSTHCKKIWRISNVLSEYIFKKVFDLTIWKSLFNMVSWINTFSKYIFRWSLSTCIWLLGFFGNFALSDPTLFGQKTYIFTNNGKELTPYRFCDTNRIKDYFIPVLRFEPRSLGWTTDTFANYATPLLLLSEFFTKYFSELIYIYIYLFNIFISFILLNNLKIFKNTIIIILWQTFNNSQ